MPPRFLKSLKTRLTFSRATPAMAARSFPLIRWSSRMRPFEQRAGNTAPHRQEARGGQGLVGLSQACRQDGREILVGLRIVFGAVLKRLPGDVSECRVAQGDGRCRPRLVD